ncbi:hypothetical protein AB0T83_16975, partial [Fluviibacterium sp. DFM31]
LRTHGVSAGTLIRNPSKFTFGAVRLSRGLACPEAEVMSRGARGYLILRKATEIRGNIFAQCQMARRKI